MGILKWFRCQKKLKEQYERCDSCPAGGAGTNVCPGDVTITKKLVDCKI